MKFLPIYLFWFKAFKFMNEFFKFLSADFRFVGTKNWRRHAKVKCQSMSTVLLKYLLFVSVDIHDSFAEQMVMCLIRRAWGLRNEGPADSYTFAWLGWPCEKNGLVFSWTPKYYFPLLALHRGAFFSVNKFGWGTGFWVFRLRSLYATKISAISC